MEQGGQSADPPLQLELEANAPSVGLARHAVSEFAEQAGADAGAVAIAVSEAVTNVVLHAYTDRPAGTINVSASRNGEGILVTVQDDGRGIAPNPDSPGLGFGLALVAHLADEIGIRAPADGGTTISMRFRYARSG
ncbi:MAG: ATP-binding protein [Actinomycetota bacterium]|nr:ATP-binding protein [Actinomycetota bacterium]